MPDINGVLKEIGQVLCSIQPVQLDSFTNSLRHASRVFVVGEGRSGLMGKAFAMRLMHVGKEVYVVGETICPPIKNGDLLIAISGSGTTPSVVAYTKKAREVGSNVYAISAHGGSLLVKQATDVLCLPAATKHRLPGEVESRQPMGSLFDQCCHLVLDAVCATLADSIGESHEALVGRHSNLE